MLGHDGFVAEADWPAAESRRRPQPERHLVENTREDVRHIVDVADIEDPEEIEIVVARQWKHRALDIASEADGDVVGSVMRDEELRTRGEAAADYAKEFAATSSR